MRTATRTLSVRVLGDFAVDGVDLADLGSRKARLLLRLLALSRGRFVEAAALADAIWGAQLPARPADQVSVLVSRIRRVLGSERIERGDAGYRLRYDRLDADELAALVSVIAHRRAAGHAAEAAAAARVALELVRGEPAAPATVAEWVAAEVAALGRLISQARTLAGETLLATGSWLDAAMLAGQLIERDPYDEAAVRLLMQANVAGGRSGAALKVYAALRNRLADDLGTEPSGETAALHLAVLRGEVTLAAPVRPASPLVGRAAELACLDEYVARPGTQVVSLVGEAGIGKSALLRAWSETRAGPVVSGACGPLERSVPLDALLTALVGYLRALDPAAAAALVTPDAAVLGPLLGLPERAQPAALSDRALGPGLLFTALAGLLTRIAGTGRVTVVLDDAHLAGPALADLLAFLLRRDVPAVVVAATRPDEGEPLPSTARLELGPLDAAATAELVGAARADELFARTQGNPLLLTELAASAAEELPTTLVAAVSQRCAALGPAGSVLQSAAVVGPRIDARALAQVLGRPAVEVLDALELAARRRLLVAEGGRFAFRHELVRHALSAASSASRRELLHREMCRVLSIDDGADPAEVAEHARLGGEPAMAARFLRSAAARAAERFDHATAERLLDEALQLHPNDAGRLARARVRIRRGDYPGAADDAAQVRSGDGEADEVAAWAAYFDRRFDDAWRHAEDGRTVAADAAVRARCLMVGGRTEHARGHLLEAERLLGAAVETAQGSDRTTAQAWLGVLRAHQSRPDDALRLLRPAAARADADNTPATLHAILFAGHAYALRGDANAALVTLERYTDEVERRQAPRFTGRGVNFAGWVLRNLGAVAQGVDRHHEALDAAARGATRDVRVAALEDLAEDSLHRGDPEAAGRALDDAQAAMGPDLVFGWRLQMKADLLRARIALALGDFAEAENRALALAAQARAARVPRYAAPAELVVELARPGVGEPANLAAADAALEQIGRAVAIEAWWWYGEAARHLDVAAWAERAETLVVSLARAAGAYGDTLRTAAERRLAQWR